MNKKILIFSCIFITHLNFAILFICKDHQPIELKVENVDLNQTGQENKIGINERNAQGNPINYRSS